MKQSGKNGVGPVFRAVMAVVYWIMSLVWLLWLVPRKGATPLPGWLFLAAGLGNLILSIRMLPGGGDVSNDSSSDSGKEDGLHEKH